MCGIVGLVYTNRDRIIEPSLLESMCSVIHHRGPDDWGIWGEGGIGLGMKRLKIIDLLGGQQPMVNYSGNLYIVFNGEIYNYRELRKDLQAKGYKFRSSSDTETILYAYEEYGADCTNYLRGMFAFAVWNIQKQQLFLARDRFGKKPLHYLFDGEKFIFGSEIKSILQHPDVCPEVNRLAVAKYLHYGYVPDPISMFMGLNKLPAGHSLTWKDGKISIRKYWDIEFRPDDPAKTDKFYFDEVVRLLREAVKIRMISDVPLGAFLSGGIDSSLVVAMMAMQTTEPIKTFSIGFEEQEYNELSYARMVAKVYGTDHHEEIVRPDAERVIPEIINNFDEPFADSSAIPTYYVSKLARQHVTVALSGDGGDEIFAGYDRYFDSQIAEHIDLLPQWLKGSLLNSFASCFSDKWRGGNTLRYLASEPNQRYTAKMAGSVHRNIRLLHEELIALSGRDSFGEEVAHSLYKTSSLDKLSRRQYADIKNYLVGDILTKVDRSSMLVSLEVRAPFLDQYLAEFASQLPLSLKVRNRTLKYVLKSLAKKYLPHELVDRPKMGFALPIKKWINNEWREFSNDLVLSDRALGRNNVNADYLQQVFREHRSGMRDYSGLIWGLMVLEMWYRRYIDG